MVDRHARDRLAELVRQLASGQINTDCFAIHGELIVEDSQDDGAKFVYCAAATLRDDTLWPIRYRGRSRLPTQTRRRLAIAALFLYSDQEYAWPKSTFPKGASVDCLLLCCCGVFFIAGFGLLILASQWFIFAIPAAACLISIPILYQISHRLATKFFKRWEAEQYRFGDYDVWPFLRREDFDAARQHPTLFCG